MTVLRHRCYGPSCDAPGVEVTLNDVIAGNSPSFSSLGTGMMSSAVAGLVVASVPFTCVSGSILDKRLSSSLVKGL